MKGKYLLFVIIGLFILLSCQSKQSSNEPLSETNQRLLIGDWYPKDGITGETIFQESGKYAYLFNEPEQFNLTSYGFYENNICENHLGFYEYIDPLAKRTFSHLYKKNQYKDEHDCICGNEDNAWFQNVIRSYGNRTTYQVVDDSLHIYDPALKHWMGQRIEFHTADTLVLFSQNDTISEAYWRKTYRISKKPLVDQIIIQFPETNYSRTKYFSINRTGQFISCGYKGVNKYVIGQIEKGLYTQVENWFKKATIENSLAEIKELDSKYYVMEDESLQPKSTEYDPYVTFIIKNQMITIGYKRTLLPILNREFYQALFSTLFLPDNICIKPSLFKQERIVSPIWNDIWGKTKFERQDENDIYIYPTERFYLSTLILHARQSKQEFIPLYKLKGLNDSCQELDIEQVETDGQFYRYIIDGVPVTLDIGFNFIEKYGLDQRQ